MIFFREMFQRYNSIKAALRKSVAATRMFELQKPCYPHHAKIESLFQEFQIQGSAVSALDLGSGPEPKNPFHAPTCHGVDIRESRSANVVYADLANGILPFPDNSFDYVTAFDVLEHIPRVAVSEGETVYPFIRIMNEISRVLKNGGIFFSIQPCYPAKEAFQDPTHVNVMSEDTMELYFCERAWARIYGFEGSFALLDDGWVRGKYFSFMKKTHDKPVNDPEFVQR